jgi:hypothetical protein
MTESSTTTASTTTTNDVQESSSSAQPNDESTTPLDHVDYRDQGGPCLSLLWSSEKLVGQSLYLGGEEGLNGQIYCIPGHSTRVLAIDTKTDEVYPIGPVLEGKFKWLRGVRVGDIIYGLPCHAPTVLRIDTRTQEVTTIPILYEEFYSSNEGEAKAQRDMNWKYHGGNVCPIDGCIYTIPQSAWHVLKIDPATDTCSLVPSQPLVGRYKWYGGVVGHTDHAIYGIPHNASSVIRIDPSAASPDDVVTLHGNYPNGNHKWHGASVAGNGTIVSVPANADTVLCIEPNRPTPKLYELGSSTHIQTGRHRTDGKYKYLGAMAGSNDGHVYCFPSGSERVLQVNAEQGSVQTIGPNLHDTNMERMLQNKWQNGLACDNFVYAIPLSAESVLRIDTAAKEVTTWKLPSPFAGLAKWEGGLIASNGAMYCMPNNYKAVLRIGSSPSPVAVTGSEQLK